MKFLSSFLLLSCFAVLGHSLPHNWRHSHTSHRTYSSKRWGYNPHRQYNSNRWGHNPYRYHYKMHNKGFAKDSRTVEPRCEAIPLSPPKDGGNLVPSGAMVFYKNASQVNTDLCGKPCFSETCYNKVPMECCEKADSQFFTMESFFTGSTCKGPLNLDEISVYLGGGCSSDGTFFYGEMCGGSNYGAFKTLSDGTPLNLGVCDQPDNTCECNAYVQTKEPGCFTIGTPLNRAEQYFMKVNDPVCTQAVLQSPAPKSLGQNKPRTREEWEAYCAKQEEYVEGCFEFTVSLVYTANTTCQEQAPADSGFWWPEQTLRKPVGVCTKNVIGNTVIFECDPEKGIINERVYHDVLDGSVCQGAQCTCESDIIYTLPIENGCSEQFFGGMHMVWDDFCPVPKKPGCPETKPAPSTVSNKGLVSKGKVMRIPDSKDMPDECGPIFFSGNTDIFQVPDKCCTAEVGAEDWLPLESFGSYKGIDGCYALDPFQNGAITAILVNGCYDDGTQFYGEKCGGSDFGDANEFAYGDCGPARETCACNLYVESKSPGCFAIATPEADPQLAVFLKMEGCERNYFPNL